MSADARSLCAGSCLDWPWKQFFFFLNQHGSTIHTSFLILAACPAHWAAALTPVLMSTLLSGVLLWSWNDEGLGLKVLPC